VPIVLKSGILKLLEPSGPVQACTGIAFSFIIYLFSYLSTNISRFSQAFFFPPSVSFSSLSYFSSSFSLETYFFATPLTLFLLFFPCSVPFYWSICLILSSYLPSLPSFQLSCIAYRTNAQDIHGLTLKGNGAQPTLGSFFCGFRVQIITKPIWKQCAPPIENKEHATKQTCYTVRCTVILGLRNTVFQVEAKQGYGRFL